MQGIDVVDLRVLMEHLPDFTVVIDGHARLVWVNRLDPSLRAEDVLGRRIVEFVHESGRAEAMAAFERCLRTGEPDHYEVLGYAAGEFSAHYRCRLIPLPVEPGCGPRVLMISTDVTQAQRDRAQRETMLAELDHRVKNTLATVTAIVEQTLQRASSMASFKDVLIGRLRSLTRAHETLAASQWANVELSQMLRVVVEPIIGPTRLAVGSADPPLPAEVVTPLALALHELATNAVKHGALRRPDGSVSLRSELDAGERLRLEWREHGRAASAPASVSTNTGLGLTLVRGLLEHDLGGRLTLADETGGRHYTLELPLASPERGGSS